MKSNEVKEGGAIEYNVFSVYLKNNQSFSKDSSHIKFGGWDQEGLADGETLHMVSTQDTKSWSFKFSAP